MSIVLILGHTKSKSLISICRSQAIVEKKFTSTFGRPGTAKERNCGQGRPILLLFLLKFLPTSSISYLDVQRIKKSILQNVQLCRYDACISNYSEMQTYGCKEKVYDCIQPCGKWIYGRWMHTQLINWIVMMMTLSALTTKADPPLSFSLPHSPYVLLLFSFAGSPPPSSSPVRSKHLLHAVTYFIRDLLRSSSKSRTVHLARKVENRADGLVYTVGKTYPASQKVAKNPHFGKEISLYKTDFC